MKKYVVVALFAAIFTVPAWCQYTDAEEAEDSVVVVIDEDYVPELLESERVQIQNLLARASAKSIVYNDECGSVIYKNGANKYGYINIRTSKQMLFEGMDFIELVDITGCGLADGILVKNANKIAVYTTNGAVLIPEVEADGLVDVMRNPFKTTSTNYWGYAIVKSGDEFYATSTKGELHELDLDRVAFGVNIIMGYKGDDIYVYNPDESEKPERIFNTNDDVEYVEVEILETQGHGRYDYEGTKYNDITPGLVVKKGLNYLLYPGAKKLIVHKSGDVLVGKVGTKKVIFSPFYTPANVAKVAIIAAED